MSKPGSAGTNATGSAKDGETQGGQGTSEFDVAFDEIAADIDRQDTAAASAADGSDDGASADGDTGAGGDNQAASDKAGETKDDAASGDASSSQAGGNSAGADKPDRWAKLNLSPEQRASLEANPNLAGAFDALAAERDQLDQNLRIERGRSNRYATNGSGNSATADGGKPAGSGQAKKSPTREVLDAPEFREFETQYPEAAAPLRKGLEATEARQNDLETRVNEIGKVTSAIVDERTEQLYLSRQDAITDKHADWEKIVGSKEFKTWVVNQPGWVQGLVRVNESRIEDVDAALFLLDTFKSANSTGSSDATGDGQRPNPSPNTATRRSRQLEGSASVRSSGVGRGSGPPDDFGAAFDYHADQVDKETTGRNARRR